MIFHDPSTISCELPVLVRGATAVRPWSSAAGPGFTSAAKRRPKRGGDVDPAVTDLGSLKNVLLEHGLHGDDLVLPMRAEVGGVQVDHARDCSECLSAEDENPSVLGYLVPNPEAGRCERGSRLMRNWRDAGIAAEFWSTYGRWPQCDLETGRDPLKGYR